MKVHEVLDLNQERNDEIRYNEEDPHEHTKCCYFGKNLRHKINEDVKKSRERMVGEDVIDGNLDEVFLYNVDVTPLQSDKISFHHASCYCNVPDIKLHKYINLRSYPYLNHVHVAMMKSNEKMFVWTMYGGIAAL